MALSIKDIADELHLSKATVSWILSGQGEKKGFSSTTIKRVKEYADQVGYRPNQLARSLSLGTTHMIGLIVPFIGDTFYAQIAEAIEHEASQKKYSLIVSSSLNDGDKELELVRNMRSLQVDGIIMATNKHSDKGVVNMINEKYPFVLIDRYYPEYSTNYVIVNNENACYEVVSEMYAKGARCIACMTTDTHLVVMKQRLEGFRRACADSNISNCKSMETIVDRNNYKKEICTQLDYILSTFPNLDGIFFTTHYLAVEAIRYFIHKRINYLKRFVLGCFHSTEGLDILAPGMIISKMPVDKIGSEAIRILLQTLKEKGKNDYEKLVLNNTLEVI